MSKKSTKKQGEKSKTYQRLAENYKGRSDYTTQQIQSYAAYLDRRAYQKNRGFYLMKEYTIKEYTETAQKARAAGFKTHSMGELIADQQRSLNDKQVNALYNAQIRAFKDEYKTKYNKARKEYMEKKKEKFMSFTEYIEKKAEKGKIELFSKRGIRMMKGRELYNVMVEYTGSLTGEAFREAIDSPSTRG